MTAHNDVRPLGVPDVGAPADPAPPAPVTIFIPGTGSFRRTVDGQWEGHLLKQDPALPKWVPIRADISIDVLNHLASVEEERTLWRVAYTLLSQMAGGLSVDIHTLREARDTIAGMQDG